jgi:hypothetical protein
MGPRPAIPTQSSHVNLETLQVFKDVGGKGGVVLQLQPYTPLTLFKTEGGCPPLRARCLRLAEGGQAGKRSTARLASIF